MSPSTDGGVVCGSGTKVLLAEEANIRKRGQNGTSVPDDGFPTKASWSKSKNEGTKGLAFHVKKFAWTLFTIPLCRAIVFVIFAVVSFPLIDLPFAFVSTVDAR